LNSQKSHYTLSSKSSDKADAGRKFIGADANAPGSTFKANDELIYLGRN